MLSSDVKAAANTAAEEEKKAKVASSNYYRCLPRKTIISYIDLANKSQCLTQNGSIAYSQTNILFLNPYELYVKWNPHTHRSDGRDKTAKNLAHNIRIKIVH